MKVFNIQNLIEIGNYVNFLLFLCKCYEYSNQTKFHSVVVVFKHELISPKATPYQPV